MTLTLIPDPPDYTTLPGVLLDDFKAWIRVDHADDDAAISSTLARAISQLERQFAVSIHPRVWTETITELGAAFYLQEPPVPVPLRGIVNFTAFRGGVLVPDEYKLLRDYRAYPFGPVFLTGPFLVDDDLGFQVGFGIGPFQMPPDLMDVVFRYAAFMWENRESGAERNLSEMPDWVDRAWSGFWVPRA